MFGLILMDDICGRLDKNSWLVRKDYTWTRERKWYQDVFMEKKVLFPPLEATRFLFGVMDRKSLFDMIRSFNLKHRTYAQFEKILESVLGGKVSKGFAAMMGSMDLREYASRYNKKI